MLDGSLVRVKIWTRDGNILYSDEPRLNRRALRARRGRAPLDRLRASSRPRSATSPSRRTATSAPTASCSRSTCRSARRRGKPLLFEAYYRYSLVAAQRQPAVAQLRPDLARRARRCSSSCRSRSRGRSRGGCACGCASAELLLRRALEASDVERRQIASDLHDGAVQDLAGVAYSLSATARRDGRARLPARHQGVEDCRRSRSGAASAPCARSSSTSTRPTSTRSPSTPRSPTSSRARLNGACTSTLDIDLHDPLPDSVARLLYRSAQEGLRNAFDHADAGTVTVRGCAERRDGAASRWSTTAAASTPHGVAEPGGRPPRTCRLPRSRDRRRRSARTYGRSRARERPARGGSAVTIRVVIADDHAVVRGGLEQLLSTADDLELVGAAADGEEAVATCPRERPDVVLMDLSMPERRRRRGDPSHRDCRPGEARIVVLTSFGDDRHIPDALARRRCRLRAEARRTGRAARRDPRRGRR